MATPPSQPPRFSTISEDEARRIPALLAGYWSFGQYWGTWVIAVVELNRHRGLSYGRNGGPGPAGAARRLRGGRGGGRRRWRRHRGGGWGLSGPTRDRRAPPFPHGCVERTTWCGRPGPGRRPIDVLVIGVPPTPDALG